MRYLIPDKAGVDECESKLRSLGLDSASFARYPAPSGLKRLADKLVWAQTIRVAARSKSARTRIAIRLTERRRRRFNESLLSLRGFADLMEGIWWFAETVWMALRMSSRRWANLHLSRCAALANLAGQLSTWQPECVVGLQRFVGGGVLAAQHWCTEQGVPFILMPRQWDNATSKSFLPIRPSMMLTYTTPQAALLVDRGWALRAKAIGSPLRPRREVARSLILVAGSTRDPRPIMTWLELLDREVFHKREMWGFPNLKILWRPHPSISYEKAMWRDVMCEYAANLKITDLDHSVLDGAHHRDRLRSIDERLTHLEEYETLLDRTVLVVAEPTSVMVDAVASGIPVILVNPRDRSNWLRRISDTAQSDHVRMLVDSGLVVETRSLSQLAEHVDHAVLRMSALSSWRSDLLRLTSEFLPNLGRHNSELAIAIESNLAPAAST